MPYLGSWALDETLTWYLDTAIPETGQVQDATWLPTYRIYDLATQTPIWQETMARLDDTSMASVTFTPTTANYVRLVSLSDTFGQGFASCAELRCFADGEVIPQNQMSVVSVDSQETNGYLNLASYVLDGDPQTFWHTEYVLTQPGHPHTLTLALGNTYDVEGFYYLPIQLANPTGTIQDYEFYTSMDGTTWNIVATGGMPLLPPATTTVGWYVAQLPLLATTGFLPGHHYGIRMAASVGGIAGAVHHTFSIAGLAAQVVTAARDAWQAATGIPRLSAGGVLRVAPARMPFRAATPQMGRSYPVIPPRLAWNPSGRSFPIDPEGRRGRLVRRPRRINWRFATRPGVSRVLRQDHPLAQGLVSWWLVRPWMTKGWIWYDLISRNHGRLIGMGHSATSGWGGTMRLGGQGDLRFDSVDDYVDAGAGIAGNLDMPASFTCAAWIYCLSFGGGGLGRILDKRASGGGYALLVNNVDVAGGLSLNINDAASYGQDYATTAAGTILTGRWLRVMATVHAATTIRFYVNGLEVAQDVGSGTITQAPIATTVSLQFGAAPQRTDRNFEGFLDDLRLYRRALSAREAAQDYQLSLLGYPGLLTPPRPLWVMVRLAAVSASPSRLAWRAATAVAKRGFALMPSQMAWKVAVPKAEWRRIVSPARLAWQAATARTPRGFVQVSAARLAWRVVRTNTGQFVRVQPAHLGL